MALRLAVKRVFDVVMASVVGVVAAPFGLVVAIAVRMRLGSPVLFRQTRLGKDGRPFDLLKFRSMTEEGDADGILLPDAERLTPFGRFLRSSSLDELPELLNVLRGEMSLVGPRPLPPQYRDLYSAEQWRRHEVRPGIGGPVVVYGRNEIDWQTKFKLDVWYVDNWSLWLDVKLLVATIWKAISRQGVTQPGHATVEFFRGNR